MPPFAVNPDVGLWETNALLNGRNSHYVTGEVEGTLSIKTVLNGVGHWITPEGRYRVEPGSYLVLNRGQRYGVDIRSRELVETFCVFFKPGFVEGVNEALNRELTCLLEDQSLAESEAGFYERLNPANDAMTSQLKRLRNFVKRGEASELEASEIMIGLATALLRSQSESLIQRERLDYAKVATREEIYKRLGVARDYILSNLDRALDLEAIAASANLSPFHFHRLFKSAFGCTPHEFLAARRLAKARHLLTKSSLPVTEIAWAIGFESPAAFSKFFSKSTGTSPRAFRSTLNPRA